MLTIEKLEYSAHSAAAPVKIDLLHNDKMQSTMDVDKSAARVPEQTRGWVGGYGAGDGVDLIVYIRVAVQKARYYMQGTSETCEHSPTRQIRENIISHSSN
jgi:hypothetical protein